MSLFSPSRLLLPPLLGLLLAAIAPAVHAGLVEYRGGGSIVETSGPAPDGLSPDAAPYLAFSFVFDTAQPPIVTSETAATYAAFSATYTVNGSLPIVLQNPTLQARRDTTTGEYIYLLQGTSAQGWRVSYFVESPDPRFVPNLDLPLTEPVIEDEYWALVLVTGENPAWSAYSDTTGLFDILVTPDPEPALPTIHAHPQSVAASWGGSATFMVRATSDSRASYQWQKDGIDLRGATEPMLNVRLVLPHHAGEYRVVVSNAAGSVTSDPATLTIRRLPIVVAHPISVTVTTGESARLSVNAYSVGEVSYQWFKDGALIAGATSSTLTIQRAHAGASGDYHAVITNAVGSATSRSATVTVQ